MRHKKQRMTLMFVLVAVVLSALVFGGMSILAESAGQAGIPLGWPGYTPAQIGPRDNCFSYQYPMCQEGTCVGFNRFCLPPNGPEPGCGCVELPKDATCANHPDTSCVHETVVSYCIGSAQALCQTGNGAGHCCARCPGECKTICSPLDDVKKGDCNYGNGPRECCVPKRRSEAIPENPEDMTINSQYPAPA